MSMLQTLLNWLSKKRKATWKVVKVKSKKSKKKSKK